MVVKARSWRRSKGMPKGNDFWLRIQYRGKAGGSHTWRLE
jgi:hypothetical protein